MKECKHKNKAYRFKQEDMTIEDHGHVYLEESVLIIRTYCADCGLLLKIVKAENS